MTTLETLLERVKRWLGRHSRDDVALVWRSHCAGHPLSNAPCSAFYHIAGSDYGTFEIFEEGGRFLLSFPRPLRLPAELFSSLIEAKNCALTALIQGTQYE